MEDANKSGGELYMCATDVHKAFDQVWREATMYLMYAYGVKGKLLRMVDAWVMNNVAIPLWRGIKGTAIRLGDNGLRQGCVISPLLYLIIIDTMSGQHNMHDMPTWDEGYIHEVFHKERLGNQDVMAFVILCFVDDTLLVSNTVEGMQEQLDRYYKFTRKWRIRINIQKSAIVPISKHCSVTAHGGAGVWVLKGEEIPVKHKHKYLG